jgi:hypothetical protein
MALPFRRKVPEGLTFYGTSQWFNLTGKAVDYILEQVASTDILRRFRFTYCADEIFFQTLLLNSPLASSCVNRCLRYLEFENGSRPRTLSSADYAQLIENPDGRLFARKFDSTRADWPDIERQLQSLNGAPSPTRSLPC